MVTQGGGRALFHIAFFISSTGRKTEKHLLFAKLNEHIKGKVLAGSFDGSGEKKTHYHRRASGIHFIEYFSITKHPDHNDVVNTKRIGQEMS